MKAMKDYHDQYLKCYILLLADVFENFGNSSLQNYGLSHYLSIPGLRWDAMLKMTKIKFEISPFPDICVFFMKGKRCGISYISNGYSKASNKYLKILWPKILLLVKLKN